MTHSVLGRTGLGVPRIIFGTSCLGNLYQAIPYETKLAIVREYFRHLPPPVVLDSAGKYGAGLALEVIGKALHEIGVSPADVVISNKLAWARVPLVGAEPTFEPGAWKGLEHDAEQRISYEGIRECWQQGCELLGEPYRPSLASVHDPDEYLAQASSPGERKERWRDVLGAYRALSELKERGEVRAVGVGSKDWTVVRELAKEVDLDWAMFACSLTVCTHPPELLQFVASLAERGVGIVNSAVFNAGFLIGGEFFDYRRPDPIADVSLFDWREKFLALCREHEVSPAAACVQFGLSPPGVVSVALNTSKAERVRQNVELVTTEIPDTFWVALKQSALIAEDYPYVG